MSSNIKVCCRFRPKNDIEKREERNSVKTVQLEDNNVKISDSGEYNFDHVFDENSTQEDIFNTSIAPMVNDVLNGFNCTVFAYGQTGCLDPDTPVRMYNGTIKLAKEIVLGDILMGDDSTPRKVLKLFSGEDDMYDIIPAKGKPYRVNKDHVLTLKHITKPFVQWCPRDNKYNIRWYENGRRRVKSFAILTSVENNKHADHKEEALVEVKKYLEKLTVYDQTFDIKVSDYLEQSATWKSMCKGFRTGVNYKSKKLSVDPYILGLWLGNDSNNSLYGSKPLSQRFKNFIETHNLVKNKHIPFSYLVNSMENRQMLLAGIMDSNAPNGFQLTYKNERLIDDIVELCGSLGFDTSKKKYITCVENYYRCYISGENTETIPVVLHHKKVHGHERCTDIKVIYSGKGQYNGFMLDGNHRFLLGDFTVTHNSGKTHTLMGYDGNRGVIPRMVERLFDEMYNADEDVQFILSVSFVEIYLEKIRDLLNPVENNLRIREGGYKNGIWIEGVTEQYVGSYEDILDVIDVGNSNRSVASTKMNEYSSRSHSIFLLNLEQSSVSTGVKKYSKLVIVDLAGSEKVEKTGATGLTLLQAQHTNKSLSCLGIVIKSLTENASHIPYRDSKLTRILTDSLGGNSKTCLIITCSLSDYNITETISTLRFGSSVKTIKNKPTANIEISISEYKRLLNEANNRIKTIEENGGYYIDDEGKEKEQKIRELEALLVKRRNEIDDLTDDFKQQLAQKEEELSLLEFDMAKAIDDKDVEIEEQKREIEMLKSELGTLKKELLKEDGKSESSAHNVSYLKRLLNSRAEMIDVLENALKSVEISSNAKKDDYENTIRRLHSQIDELHSIMYRPKNIARSKIARPIKRK